MRHYSSRKVGTGKIPENLYKERCWEASKIFADHLLADTFAADEKLRCSSRPAVEKLTCVQVRDTPFWISVRTAATRYQK